VGTGVAMQDAGRQRAAAGPSVPQNCL